MTTTTTKKPQKQNEGHPARFSKRIIDLFRELIPPGVHVHDPCGGTGERLGALCDALSCTFSGTELEPCFIEDSRVVEGNACDGSTYPRHPFWIVTSVVYANGVADDFKAKDGSARNTYRQAVAAIEGKDRKLHPDNQGQYGYRGTKRGGTSKKRKAYWDIARRYVQHWKQADQVILNVSDFKANKGVIEPHVQDWIDLLLEEGFDLRDDIDVDTPRYKNGSDDSRDERVEYERVMIFDCPG